MELQFFAATDQLHVGSGLVQQPRQVECGSSAADHDNVVPPKRLNLAMASAMRKELCRQVSQILGNVLEVSNPNCEHDPAGLECLSILKPQKESAGHPLHADHELVFQLRYHAVPEGKPISTESIKAHRHTGIGILDSSFRAELAQSERFLRVIDVGREAI